MQSKSFVHYWPDSKLKIWSKKTNSPKLNHIFVFSFIYFLSIIPEWFFFSFVGLNWIYFYLLQLFRVPTGNNFSMKKKNYSKLLPHFQLRERDRTQRLIFLWLLLHPIPLFMVLMLIKIQFIFYWDIVTDSQSNNIDEVWLFSHYYCCFVRNERHSDCAAFVWENCCHFGFSRPHLITKSFFFFFSLVPNCRGISAYNNINKHQQFGWTENVSIGSSSLLSTAIWHAYFEFFFYLHMRVDLKIRFKRSLLNVLNFLSRGMPF